MDSSSTLCIICLNYCSWQSLIQRIGAECCLFYHVRWLVHQPHTRSETLEGGEITVPYRFLSQEDWSHCFYQKSHYPLKSQSKISATDFTWHRSHSSAFFFYIYKLVSGIGSPHSPRISFKNYFNKS